MRSGERGRARLPVFIFDFGGVVIKWKSNHPIYDYVADRYGIPRSELRRVFDLAIPGLESGRVSMRKFLEDALGLFGMRLRRGDSPEELWTLPFERLAKLRVGTVKLVESLRRKGYRVIVFSNTSPPHVKFMKRVGWDKLFDGFLASCELGSVKPSRTAYETALKRINAAPSEVVFIDDKAENVRGAKEFGIRRAFTYTSLARLKKDIERIETNMRKESGDSGD